MEKVNGDWIMKERADQDPLAIHGIDDLLTLVGRVGFLPLFSNSINGFSVEEHVPGTSWWTGDPATDPWEWRQILASHPDIAYGKFFNNAAGFVDREFFPVFANYRRNGYDFDALFDDGMVSYRAKKIMNVFDLDEKACGKEFLSYQILGIQYPGTSPASTRKPKESKSKQTVPDTINRESIRG